MVFGGQDQSLHAAFFGRLRNLIGIEVGRARSTCGIFIAVAPFLVGERVDREVKEAVELHLVPAQLTLRGRRSVRCGWVGGFRRGRGHAAEKNDTQARIVVFSVERLGQKDQPSR